MVDRTGLHTAPVPGTPPIGTAPTDGRLVQGALFGTGGRCLSGGGYTASSSNMQFAVAAGVYQIPDTANAGAVYHSPVDGVTLTPAPGQAGGRIDSIYVLQQDFEKNGTTSRVIYGLAAGTAGSGTAPSLSGIAGGPMRLANISVPASASKATDCTVTWVVPPATVGFNGLIVANRPLLDLITGAYVGQLAYVGDVTYRWGGTPAQWRIWDWLQVPLDTYLDVANGASVNVSNAGLTEFNVSGGIATFNFALYRAGGMGTGTPYAVLKPGFRPAALIHSGGMTENNDSTSNVAAHYVDSAGGVFLLSNGGANAYGMRGTFSYRLAN